MNRGVRIADDIFWVGENDSQTNLFENIWPLPRGVSYNAYVIRDEKTVLVDAVKRGFVTDMIEKVLPLLEDGRPIDYLVVNHMEPDHSGAIRVLRQLFPKMIILGNEKTLGFLSDFYGMTDRIQVVADGEEFSTGRHNLRFHLTPMVHWPETMMTHDETTSVLFSGDAFGGFGVLPGGIFDDEVDIDYFEEETLRYFTNIVGKYAKMVEKAITKLAGLDISVIAPTHGPVWRKNPERIVGAYTRWARQETEPGVVIVYASMYGNTGTMMEAVSSGLAEAGMDKVRIHNVSRTHGSFILNDIWRYNTFLFASPTYNTKVFPLMDDFMRLLSNIRLTDRSVGIVGTYGWSGGGVKDLKAYSEAAKFNIIEPVIEAKCGPTAEDLGACRELGQSLAAAARGD